MIGTMKNSPGPRSPTYLPRRSTATFSHWFAILSENSRYAPTRIPITAGAGLSSSTDPLIPAAMHNTKAANPGALVSLNSKRGPRALLAI